MCTEKIDFINDKNVREDFIDRVEVLDRVKGLISLPNMDLSTSNQVADFYKVERNVINQIVNRNRKEFDRDNIVTMSGNEVVTEVECNDNLSAHSIQRLQGGIKINDISLNYARNTLFSRRSILRVGMMLEQSEVASEIRDLLLNTFEDAEVGKDNIIENIVADYNEEERLIMARVKAEMDGNWDEVSMVNAKLFHLKNKRIKELEEENEFIITNALTIQESLSVIRAIVNHIGFKSFKGVFANAWNELHKKVNYKLNINIRKRDGSGSLLSRYSDDEIIKVEKIAKSWAIELGYDLDDILKIGVKVL